MKTNILIVDDEKDLCWAVREKLLSEGYGAEYVLSGEEALDVLAHKKFDLMILDYRMAGLSGLDVLEHLRSAGNTIPAIFITAYGDQDLAMKSLEAGANDYVHKPFNLDNLMFRIYKTIRFETMEQEVRDLRPRARASFANIITQSPEIEKIMSIIDRVAPKKVPVLITGETGTGKDVVASAIHHNTHNPRKEKPYISINTGAIPEPLIESELFGHVKGAFTGAVTDREGVFEAADGGTLFLDEISSATPALQTRLLRVLDSGEFYRVGETKVRNADVRIIAASNRDLIDEVEKGRFREDLYHRLRVIHIPLPPLRQRHNDVAPLIDYFLRFYNVQLGKRLSMSDNVRGHLMKYEWPGNVRELKHCIESLVVMADGDIIKAEDLPERFRGMEPVSVGNTVQGTYRELKAGIVEQFDTRYFTNLLRECGGNVSEAARCADLARSYVIKKLNDCGIDPKDMK
jgi:DNA-binding NtrC family response regulator